MWCHMLLLSVVVVCLVFCLLCCLLLLLFFQVAGEEQHGDYFVGVVSDSFFRLVLGLRPMIG